MSDIDHEKVSTRRWSRFERLDIFADSVRISVVGLYAEAGHSRLPTTPTIAPWQLSNIVQGDTANRIWWIEPFNGFPSRALENNEAVVVSHGMRFTSVPRGSYTR